MSNDTFDLASLRAADTADMPVKNADGKPLTRGGKALSITVYGPGSEQFAQAQAARSQRLVARVSKRGAANGALTADEQRSENATFLASVTHSLNGGLTYEGGTDAASIERMYGDLRLGFVADQVSSFVGDWGNFSAASPTA